MASKQARMHGRIEGAQANCAVPGCAAPGEYKAPLQPAGFDGPGSWRFLCLDHVREHNSRYNFFDGMSAEQISEAQSPLAGWERPSRKFAANGGDPPPAWSDFSDPLEAISGRFGRIREPGKPSQALFGPGSPLSPGQEWRRPQSRGSPRRSDRSLSAATEISGPGLIPVGRAQREIGAVWARALDRFLDRRMGEQPCPIGLQPRTRIADLVHPVRVE